MEKVLEKVRRTVPHDEMLRDLKATQILTGFEIALKNAEKIRCVSTNFLWEVKREFHINNRFRNSVGWNQIPSNWALMWSRRRSVRSRPIEFETNWYSGT
jgi:hypothetical protein